MKIKEMRCLICGKEKSKRDVAELVLNVKNKLITVTICSEKCWKDLQDNRDSYKKYFNLRLKK